MTTDPLGLLNRLGAALTGEGSLFDRVREETSLDRLSEMCPYRVHDSESGIYINAASVGWILEIVPFLGADETVVSVLAEMFSDSIPDKAHLQIINWASPRIDPVLTSWATARGGTSPFFAKLAKHRVAHFRRGAFDSLSAHAPMFTRQFRVFVALGLEGEATPETLETLITLKANVSQIRQPGLNGAGSCLKPYRQKIAQPSRRPEKQGSKPSDPTRSMCVHSQPSSFRTASIKAR